MVEVVRVGVKDNNRCVHSRQNLTGSRCWGWWCWRAKEDAVDGLEK